ncbi:amidohydrolase [Geminicoccaceae bacterium 1502E]|nr:amidohydrolase [Geminicoccaceae bacterium 1502E]
MEAAEAIYHNGPILSLDAENSMPEAVAIAGGQILAVGSMADMEAHRGPATREIDLAGRALLPGFIDPHGHFPLSGMYALYRVDLSSPPVGDCRRLADVFGRLRERAAATAEGEWVIGAFFDQSMVEERRFPTRQELDAVSSAHPIFVVHASGHVGVANSAALAFAGIDRDTPQPPGGHIEKDEATGEPTGLLEEPAAMGPIKDAVDNSRGEAFTAGLEHATREYAAQGVTTAQNAWADKNLLQQFERAEREGRLKLRLVALPDAGLEPELASGAFTVATRPEGRLRLGARKLFSDGSIQAFTGYLFRPYHTPCRGDAEYRGYPIYDRDDLARRIDVLHRAGHQIHIHANGDAAADDVLHGFRLAQEAFPREDHRHTIIHGQMLREDQLDLMKELGVTVSFFSYHVYVWGDRHRDVFMGPERAARISPAASATARGIRYTVHNDTPVTPMRPLPLMWAAVNRLTASGEVLGPEQRISVLQALRAHTIDAAWQVFLEDEIGSIEPGKRADLVILDRNPLEDPAGLKDIRVLETIIDGETVHRA